jgi:hypothetical protein
MPEEGLGKSLAGRGGSVASRACIEHATFGGEPGNRSNRRVTTAMRRLPTMPAVDLTHSRFAFVA